MNAESIHERMFQARVKKLAQAPLDVLVIGGGIVGAGIARDAAMRGLKTGLVEQYDFAYGTSSRSSRLLHGGLRYLAQGHIGLVREASREKHVLQRIAPHLTQPLAFIFPSYRGSCWPRWKLSLGVKLYDYLCGQGNLGASRSLNARDVHEILGGAKINENGLSGGVRYFDALTNDSRLVVDTLRSAEKHGAALASYARFVSAKRDGSGWLCELQDSQSAASAQVSARCVVSAAGPWAGKLALNQLGLRLTKGVHLVIDRARLPVPDAVVMSEGQRILFVIPWGERVILGTTDTDYAVNFSDRENSEFKLADVHADRADLEYILKIANQTFPKAQLGAGDVISTWAGLRPLIAEKSGAPSDISRSHEIRMVEPGWLELAGGKLTTYRVMAEQAVDRICAQLSHNHSPSRSAAEPLLSPGDTLGISDIVPPPLSRMVVEHYCANEWATHLDDVLIRRTSWAHYSSTIDADAQRVGDWMAEILGWDDDTLSLELKRFSDWRDKQMLATK
jgi:glycerol-3-phosphate dehydrogenase